MQRCTAEVATGLQIRYWVYLYFFWDGQNTDRHWSLLYFAKTSSSRRDEDQGVQKASLSRYGTQMPMIMLCKKILFFYFTWRYFTSLFHSQRFGQDLSRLLNQKKSNSIKTRCKLRFPVVSRSQKYQLK